MTDMATVTRYILLAGVFILLDVVTGLIKALTTGTFQSSKMREGLRHKAGEVLAVALGVAIDWALPLLGVTVNYVSALFIFSSYIVLMEIGSIIENIGVMCPPVGKVLAKVFHELKATELAKYAEPPDPKVEEEDNI